MRSRFVCLRWVVALLLTSWWASCVAAPVFKVSDDGRYLVQADGTPFFWLGDTAWELFHRLNREEADRYLEDRARKGFTVIQAVAMVDLDGLHSPNPFGHRPLIENDLHLSIIRRMARGIDVGTGGTQLMTFHPQGASNSADWFHQDEWLDFNMVQSGQGRPTEPGHQYTRRNRALAPAKPTLDGEPCYEDHPVMGKAWFQRTEPGVSLQWFDEWDVRVEAYKSMMPRGTCQLRATFGWLRHRIKSACKIRNPEDLTAVRVGRRGCFRIDCLIFRVSSRGRRAVLAACLPTANL